MEDKALIFCLKEDFKDLANKMFADEVQSALRFLINADNLDKMLREYLEGDKYEQWQAVLSDAYDKVAEFAGKMGISTEL